MFEIPHTTNFLDCPPSNGGDLPLPVSAQRKFIYGHSNRRKGDHDPVWSIIQNQSVCWCTGNQEEVLLGVYSRHRDTSWCGCRSSWGIEHCLLWVLSWQVIHIILVIWSHVWDSTYHQNFRLSTVQWWRPLVSWDHIGSVWILWWIFLGWQVCQSVNLIRDWCDNWFELFCDFFIFSSESCLLDLISCLLS